MAMASESDMDEYLEALSREQLLGLVCEQLQGNDALRRHVSFLALRAVATGAKAKNGSASVAALRTLITSAADIDDVDFHSSSDAFEICDRVREAVQEIMGAARGATDPGSIELVEYAIEQSEHVMESLHDADVMRELSLLGDLHRDLVDRFRPEPVALAEKLYRLESRDGWGQYEDCGQRYGQALGAAGIARFRELLEGEWEKLPELRSGKLLHEHGRPGHPSRHKLEEMMTRMAAGDVDRLVQVKAKSLRHSSAYLEIATVLANAGRKSEALSWAERGLMESDKWGNADLLDWTLEEYARLERHEDALALSLKAFKDDPTLPAYERVRQRATALGRWPAVRERTLDELRGRLASQRQPSSAVTESNGYSPLVGIYLSEKDGDCAWTAACEGGCSRRLWLALAELREKDHPADVIPIIEREAEANANLKNNDSYSSAVHLLVRARALAKRAGDLEGFGIRLEAFRKRHKAKRNLQAALSNAGLQ